MATVQVPVSRSTIAQHSVETRTVLHVGCGAKGDQSLHQRFRGREWREIRLDLDSDVKPDVVASITDMRPIADSSVDAVWSSHNLEHLNAHEVPVALGEFLRVLKPAGFALMTLPDLQQVAEFIVADKLEDVAYDSPGRADYAAGLRVRFGTGHRGRASADGPSDWLYGEDAPYASGTGRVQQSADFLLALCALGRGG